MIKNADKSGVDSTASNDRRITGVGQFVRRYKLDELTQLWNVHEGRHEPRRPAPERRARRRACTRRRKSGC